MDSLIILIVFVACSVTVLICLSIALYLTSLQRRLNRELLAAIREENVRSRDAADAQLEAYRADTRAILSEMTRETSLKGCSESNIESKIQPVHRLTAGEILERQRNWRKNR